MSFYGDGTFYGSGSFFSPTGVDVPISLDFTRTDMDNIYTFRWTFDQNFFTSTLKDLDFQLQIDQVSTFDSVNLFTYTTSTEDFTIPAVPTYTITLSLIPQRILVVESGTTKFTPVATAPAAGQYLVDLSTGILTFNAANAGAAIRVIYVDVGSTDILEFHRGNVVKGFSIPIYVRTDDSIPFYARVRSKSGPITFTSWSSTLSLQTLPDTTRAAADDLINGLPDRHVYPYEEALKPLSQRTKNISFIYEMLGNEFDLLNLEMTLTQEDGLTARTRDARIYDVYGRKFGFLKSNSMEFTDYRYIVESMWRASLIGGTYNAIKFVGRSFTGVDPIITPFSELANFITAAETTTSETVTVPGLFPFQITLSKIPRNLPSVRGSSISAIGAATALASVKTLFVNINGDGVQTITLAIDNNGFDIATDIQTKIQALTAVTPANQIAFDNFIVEFVPATLQYILASGTDSTLSTVVILGGTAAADLKLGIANGGTETTGLSVPSPYSSTPAVGEYSINFTTGEVTFNAANSGQGPFYILYNATDTIYTYVPEKPALYPTIPTVPSYTPNIYDRTETGFSILITLNNPAGFTLDLSIISFLIKQIVPAHTRFVLITNP